MLWKYEIIIGLWENNIATSFSAHTNYIFIGFFAGEILVYERLITIKARILIFILKCLYQAMKGGGHAYLCWEFRFYLFLAFDD